MNLDPIFIDFEFAGAFITLGVFGVLEIPNMPKGLKQTSDIIAVSTGITESAANTFTTSTIELALSPLDNQVFVIVKVDADLSTPNMVAGQRTGVDVTLSNRARTSVGSLSNHDVVAVFRKMVDTAPAFTTSINSIDEAPDEVAHGMDYLAVIFTNDMFINIIGANNTAASNANLRIWGYRAQASSSVYAAGVAAELLG